MAERPPSPLALVRLAVTAWLSLGQPPPAAAERRWRVHLPSALTADLNRTRLGPAMAATTGHADADGWAAATAPVSTPPAWAVDPGARTAEASARGVGPQRCPALPSVALCFVGAPDLPHALAWARWLDGVDGACAAAPLQHQRCPAGMLWALAAGCPGGAGPKQHHATAAAAHTADAAAPGRPGDAAGTPPLFRLYADVARGRWARAATVEFSPHPLALTHAARHPSDHGLIDAQAALFAAALASAQNRKFVLIGAEQLPLHAPSTTFLQLVGEPGARIATAPLGPNDAAAMDRWRPTPAADGMPVPRAGWRKGSPYVTASRRVAALLAHARPLDQAFRRRCERTPDDCASAEHYTATVTAMAAADADGVGYLVASDWDTEDGMARRWDAGSLTAAALDRLRGGAACDPDLAAARAAVSLLDLGADDVPLRAACRAASPWDPARLGPGCPLLVGPVVGDAASRAQGVGRALALAAQGVGPGARAAAGDGLPPLAHARAGP